jgi:hypothetical protein
MTVTARLQQLIAEFTGEIDKSGSDDGINYDQAKGLGNVPHNQEIKYRGFGVMMRPSQFLKLAAKRDFTPDSNIAYIKKYIKQNKIIGSPFLSIMLNKKGVAIILSHEGRTRMKAIQEIKGDVPVLVHVFFDKRAKGTTHDIITAFRQLARPEMDQTMKKPPKAITGPHFSAYFFNNEWHK